MLQPDISDKDVQQAAINLMSPVDDQSGVRKDQEPQSSKIDKETLIKECHNALSHRYRARAIYKRMDYDLLCWCRELLDTLIAEKEVEIKAQKEKDQKRQSVMDKVTALLKEEGFSMNELYPNNSVKPTDDASKTKRKYKKKNPNKPRQTTYKFRCEIFNKTIYWSGTGWIPKAFRCHLAKGHTLQSCYLPKDQWLTTAEKPDVIIPLEFQDTADKLLAAADKQGIGKARQDLVIDFEMGS